MTPQKGRSVDRGRREGARDFVFELPVEEERRRRNDLSGSRGPAMTLDQPQPLCAISQDVDLKDVAGLRVANSDWASQGVDAVAIDLHEFVGGHAGADLRAAGILAFEVDGVAGIDGEARSAARDSSGECVGSAERECSAIDAS